MEKNDNLNVTRNLNILLRISQRRNKTKLSRMSRPVCVTIEMFLSFTKTIFVEWKISTKFANQTQQYIHNESMVIQRIQRTTYRQR